MMLYGNKGDWGELYIFFKVLVDGKIYAADSDYNRIDSLFLTVISLMREEGEKEKEKGKKEKELKRLIYTTGEIVRIKLNGEEFMSVPRYEFEQHIKEIWSKIKINEKEKGSFTVIEVKEFLEKIGIGNLKSPAKKTSEFFGGTIDIVMEVITHDNIKRVLGFSCKTDLKNGSTLFNASVDNTNFLYRLKGPVNDELMSEFNNIYSIRNGKNIIPTSKRMDFLKEHNIYLTFERPVSEIAEENLIISGGKEMPAIVGGMLEYFYYNNSGSQTSVAEAITNIAENDVANYSMKNLQNIYHIKVANLIYNMFTGLRFGSNWNGKAEVNGGYIVLKNDGDVVAYHSTIADEFKEFLVSKLRFESPSHSRHRDMVIEKIDGEYYLKLALQLRFMLNH